MKLQSLVDNVIGVATESEFLVETTRELTLEELSALKWILSETYEPENFRTVPKLSGEVMTIGPRLAIVTPYSTCGVSVFAACGLSSGITRIERARRYCFILAPGTTLSPDQQKLIDRVIRDRMTEQVYEEAINTFDSGVVPESVKIIPLLEKGMEALEEANVAYGLALKDPRIKAYVLDHFVRVLKRNPTNVELFKFGALNSEHCRHPQFNAEYVIDDQVQSQTLFGMIKETTRQNPGNVLSAYKDNAAAVLPVKPEIETLIPESVIRPSAFRRKKVRYCYIIKVETHNHPTGVCSPPGAATGTGGEIRDRHCLGRGGLPQAGLACYFIGHLRIPDYPLPWEEKIWEHPGNLETPLQIIVGASDGASDYGNCFGQPIVFGSTRSFEMAVGDELFGYTKPVMVAGGVGLVDSRHVEKKLPEKGMLIVQTGGDAYPVGFGGASASSMGSGENKEALDYASVQRDNPEMEQRGGRVFIACSRLGEENPIETGQDLGAGGDITAPDELVTPAGAKIYLRRIPCGDKTMIVLVLAGNESQERYVFLVKPEKLDLCRQICERERCPMAVIGEVTGDGRIVMEDEWADSKNHQERFPVELGLDFLLGNLPQRIIQAKRVARKRDSLVFPAGLTMRQALDRVFRLLSVCSKHFLTKKVDRSVGGLIIQQQTIGPLQVTLSDFAVVGDSFLSETGKAVSVGDQPILSLINAAASARMSLAESLTNLAGARYTAPEDINFSATWQAPAGLEGEDAKLFDAVKAATDACLAQMMRIPVGKDSLSMYTNVIWQGKPAKVKAPLTVEFVSMAPMPDVNRKITADLKKPGLSRLMFIDLAKGKKRLGGSALAQVFKQVGNEAPDLDDSSLLRKGMEACLELIDKGLILAVHDRSDGGLITTLLEMAFAGNCGLLIEVDKETTGGDWLSFFFNQELGLVFEYRPENEREIRMVLGRHGLGKSWSVLGRSRKEKKVEIIQEGETLLAAPWAELFHLWQETSIRLDLKQKVNPVCVRQEEELFKTNRPGLSFELTFTPKPTDPRILAIARKPKAAILREEGTNGDAEMAAAFEAAGFEAWDVTMTDLVSGRISLEDFRGIAFCGGFSFMDVFDAGKGWAGVIKFNERVAEEFRRFFARTDTFSLGVCNGCQTDALLGLVPGLDLSPEDQPRFLRNESEKFEHRFLAVEILESPSIFLSGMEGSTLGIIVAHAEGRFFSRSPRITERILSLGLAPIRYVGDDCRITERYPFNPNGSPYGVAALCSPDGRHLAMMPHPERVWQKRQWPYWPEDWAEAAESPWLRLFQNAREWCERN